MNEFHPAKRSNADCISGIRRSKRGQIKISYGEDGAGRIFHISEVDSGSNTGCFCPECKAPLIAYKSKRKLTRDHFGHRTDYACATAPETGLHKFAKQVLCENRALLLPPQIGRHEEATNYIRDAYMFSYDIVADEVIMPNMKPDIVVKRGQYELLVEIAVTHFCEEAKLDRLRERRLSAIEIDLSKVLRDASREEHVDAVLKSAPRQWLFNKRVASAEEQFRQLALDQANAVRAQHDKDWGGLAADLAAAYGGDVEVGDTSWFQAMEYAGIEEYVAKPIIGGGCFIVCAATWQSAIIHRFVLRCYGDITPWEVTEWLAEENFLKPAFRLPPVQGGTEMKKYLKAAVPDFRPPEDVVTEFMLGLARQGLLYKGRTRWSSRTPNAEKARNEWNQAKTAWRRWQEIKVVLVAIQKDAKRGSTVRKPCALRTNGERRSRLSNSGRKPG